MKYIKILVLSIFVFFGYITSVNASINTYNRTEDNLMVPSDVVVTDENRRDILSTPAVNSNEKIYDYADLYTDAEEKKIYKRLKEYTKESKIDSVIVTTRKLNGFNISDYTYNFYDYNDFKKNGIIFVIYVSDDIEIFMGNSGNKNGKVFKVYTDKRINDTLAYTYKYIEKGEYYTGTDKYISILEGFYKLEVNGNYKVDENGKVVKTIPWIEIVILSVAITFIVIMILYYKLKDNNKVIVKDNLDGKLDNSTLMVKLEKDELVGSSEK